MPVMIVYMILEETNSVEPMLTWTVTPVTTKMVMPGMCASMMSTGIC